MSLSLGASNWRRSKCRGGGSNDPCWPCFHCLWCVVCGVWCLLHQQAGSHPVQPPGSEWRRLPCLWYTAEACLALHACCGPGCSHMPGMLGVLLLRAMGGSLQLYCSSYCLHYCLLHCGLRQAAISGCLMLMLVCQHKCRVYLSV